jgi:16S rRNA (guanine527-N7)-methyltransferase
VQVVRARAEDIVRGRGPVTSLRARVVTARAVAPLERLAGWTVPLVQPGGELLALKGRTAAEEVQASAAVLERLGIVSVDVIECGVGVVNPPTTVVRASKS